MKIGAFIAFWFGLGLECWAYTQEDGIRYVQAYCYMLSLQSPTLYAKYRLQQKCFLVVEIFDSKVR